MEVTDEIEKWYQEYGLDAVSDPLIRKFRMANPRQILCCLLLQYGAEHCR